MFLTVSHRKLMEAERRSKAAGSLKTILAAHARRLGGRYLLYGSAAKGTMTFDSDIDLLLDFPDETEAEAWRAAESACVALGMEYDIMPLKWTKGRLRATVEATGLTLS
ncbi:MAG: nucleotidyltransferase domain-containing protein [Rhizobiaceae bacterium]|nr:nucleotidyltransferase domain-containing protein [Rhizobiaceae bacterium]